MVRRLAAANFPAGHVADDGDFARFIIEFCDQNHPQYTALEAPDMEAAERIV
jgi:hypothetical protein